MNARLHSYIKRWTPTRAARFVPSLPALGVLPNNRLDGKTQETPAMRVKFVVLALFMGCLVLLLGPTTGLTQFQGQGNRGGGGGGGFGGMQQDPGRIFDWMAQGQQTLVIANQRFGREDMEAWAQKQGITNGQLTREQFISY